MSIDRLDEIESRLAAAEGETVTGHAWAALDEHAPADLRRLYHEVRRLEAEEELSCHLTNRQGALLTGVVNALRGAPPELTFWSHHDAPLRAQAAADRIAELEAVLGDHASCDSCGRRLPATYRTDNAALCTRIAELEAQLAKAQKWNQDMVAMHAAAGDKLAGYRELGARCAELERERGEAVTNATEAHRHTIGELGECKRAYEHAERCLEARAARIVALEAALRPFADLIERGYDAQGFLERYCKAAARALVRDGNTDE